MDVKAVLSITYKQSTTLKVELGYDSLGYDSPE